MHTTSHRFNFFPYFLLILLLFIAVHAVYADETTIDALQKTVNALQKDFEAIKKGDVKTKDLDKILQKITDVEPDVDACIKTNTEQLEKYQQSLKLLGDKVASEDRDVQTKRIELTKKSQTVDNQLKRCNVLKIQLDQLTQNTRNLRDTLLKKQFLSREYSLVGAIKKLLLLNTETLNSELDNIQPILKKTFNSEKWPLILLGILGISLGLLWKFLSRPRSVEIAHSSSPTLWAALRGLKRTSPVLIALLFIWLYLEYRDVSQLLTTKIITYGFILTIVYGLVRGTLFPQIENLHETKLPIRLMRLLSWLFIASTLTAYFFNQEASGRYSDSALLYLIWFASLTVAAITLIILVWTVARHLSAQKQRIPGIYIFPIQLMIAVIIAASLGYRNIASLLFFGTVNSLIVITLAFFILRVSNEFFDSLDEGKRPWQKKLRDLVGLEQNQSFPGVFWLRILFFFVIASVTILLLMFIWGRSHQQLSSLLDGLKDGITIGNVNLDLFNLMYALLILVGTLSILPFIKNQLVAGWLKHSNLSRGAQEATQKLVGYAGVAIAILWSLNVAGVNFKNLAIVAGALSVGIGFGLQNIVNNFVSGLILLFERPIRRGDWVVVGNTEGYVKEISIRSTIIQTFERADVIVPNSELISNQVTNWVLSNTIGRLKVPIGVAYGTNVDQVIDILESIAVSHPDVISNHPGYPIKVLFLEFGDSALNFELRCYVRNIDHRLTVLSDINLGINREFEKANIEIPFPQRVIHLSSPSADT